jgi:hypothetical protein
MLRVVEVEQQIRLRRDYEKSYTYHVLRDRQGASGEMAPTQMKQWCTNCAFFEIK